MIVQINLIKKFYEFILKSYQQSHILVVKGMDSPLDDEILFIYLSTLLKMEDTFKKCVDGAHKRCLLGIVRSAP